MASLVLCLGTRKSQIEVQGVGCVFGGCVPEVGDQSVVRAVRPESSRELLACPCHVPVAPGFPWPAAAPFRLRVTVSVVSSLPFLVRTLGGVGPTLNLGPSHLAIPSFVTSAKTLFPSEAPLTGSAGQDADASCGGRVSRPIPAAPPGRLWWTPPHLKAHGVFLGKLPTLTVT